MEKIYFVSGIDTSVGKTMVTGLMAKYLLNQGFRVATVKLVQTGNVGYSEDRDAHRQMMGTGPLPEDELGWTAPQIFKFPSSPLLSSRLEGKTVDLDCMAESVRKVAERYDVVLVEGAGGLAVPLTEDVLTMDFAAQQGWPMILVTSGKLGSVNHTILSLECWWNRGGEVRGLVYNYCPEADPLIDEDSPRNMVRFMEQRGHSAPLVRVPKFDMTALPAVDFAPIFA